MMIGFGIPFVATIQTTVFYYSCLAPTAIFFMPYYFVFVMAYRPNIRRFYLDAKKDRTVFSYELN
jgi:hypothetical protein